MLDLDVQVETAFACVRLSTLGVGALKLALDLICAPPVMFFPSRKVPLSSGSFEILVAIVELLELEDVLEDGVSGLCHAADLLQDLLVPQEEAPVALEVVLARVVLGQLKRPRQVDWLL